MSNADGTLREEAYDEHISPLMTKIIALCKEHDIPVLASFDIQCDDDEGLMCTPAILPPHAQDCLARALSVIQGDDRLSAFAVAVSKDVQDEQR